MRLPLSLVLDTLRERFSLPLPYSGEERLLSMPVPLCGSDAPQKERLYVSAVPCEGAELAGCCILYTDGASPVHGGERCFSLPMPLTQVQQCVYSLWECVESVREGLEALVFSGCDLPEFARAMRERFNNPVIFFSSDLTLHAQSGLELLPEEWCALHEQTGSAGLTSALQRVISADTVRNEPTPHALSSRALPCRICHHTVSAGQHSAEHIVLLELERALRPVDGWLLTRLEDCIRFLLEKELRSRDDSGIRRTLQRLLLESGVDRRELGRELTDLGWRDGELYQCVLLTVGRSEAGIPDRLGAFLEQSFPCCCICSEGRLVMVLRTPTPEENDAIHSQLKVFVRENFLKVGISRALQGHGELRYQYLQACAALELGRRLSPYAWIHRFDELAGEYLLEQLGRTMPCALLCHWGVLRLQKNDERHGTDYIRTLRVLLDANMNVVQASRELFIHRSTLLYRMEKMRPLLEGALNDPRERDYLSLSLRLLDREKKRQLQE